MIRNLIKVAIRNLQRQKAFTILHMVGLSLGLTSCLLIGLYSADELNFDTFHKNGDRICRINQTFIWGDTDDLFGSTGPAVMHAVSSEVPEFEKMTRAYPLPPSLTAGTRADGELMIFEEENMLAVDSTFLEIFTFPLIAGDPKTALVHPQSIVLTSSTARKYFGEVQVVGKKLELGERADKKSYLITGVAEDVPENSHIQFDFLVSMSSIPRVKDRSDSWIWTTFVTFGLLREDADPELVSQKVAAVPGKYLDAFLQKYRGITYEEFLASDEEWNLYLQPFLDIHLRSSNVYSRLNKVGNIQTIYILCLVGGLILLISLINFVNLSTARATTRAREVGIRKVIGSERNQLIYQFLTESIIYVASSMIISLFLTELLMPAFNMVTDKNLSISPLTAPLAAGSILAATLIIGVLSGAYPAFYLSSFRPAQVLKGRIVQGLKGGAIRNVLVTAQFAISIALIACTLIVNQQVNAWKNTDLGYDKENKLVIQNVERIGHSGEAFKNRILSNPLVQAVTYSSDTPPLIFDFDNFTMKGKDNLSISVNYLTTDEAFIPIYGLELTAGRNFSEAFHDSTNVIVNESLVTTFGFHNPKDALNQHLRYNDTDFTIIGIIKDFNSGLSEKPYPTALFAENAPIYRNANSSFTVDLKRKASPDEVMALITSLEAEWQHFNAEVPFQYAFTDQKYLNIFEGTMRFSKMLRGFAILAIVIACLGLIGLVAFVIEKRNKEIGIRKVLGASASNILVLLSSDFGKLLLIGFLIASPVSWYFMSKWLENFTLRTTISVFTFLAAGAIMLLIAVLTMSFQTIRAARINPVEYLKEE